MRPGGNNFDFIRLAAATFVIISHSYALTMGSSTAEPLFTLTGGMSLGCLSVFTFFTMSGFLITKSWMSNQSIIRFIKGRSLRIFPGLAATTLITTFLIGPLNTGLSVSEYFSSLETWSYLACITIYGMRYSLPGVFMSNPFSGLVNGSLWTLPGEFTFYIVVLLSGAFGLLEKRKFLVLIPHFLSIGYCAWQVNTTGVVPLQLVWYIYFSSGAILYIYREAIVRDWRIFAGLSLLLLGSIATHSNYNLYVFMFSLPYMVIYFAFLPIKGLNSFGKYGDFSYGIYIYAFPIQQTIIHFTKGSLIPIEVAIYTLFIVVPIAVLSWHLIELPALRRKRTDQAPK
jgi:peptidoglycan/LPS O-acetylase OafA/YrhL